MRILIINGPNLNLLGTREPSVYGTATLRELEDEWRDHAAANSLTVDAFQSNHEGAIVDAIQEAMGRYDGLIINAGALTHYSYSVRDAVAGVGIPSVEVHISNVHEREAWRHFSVLSEVCDLTIVGRGTDGYLNAIAHLAAEHAIPSITAAYGDHSEAVLDLRTPPGEGPHPVVLLIHGGFWQEIWKRDLMDPMAVALVEVGWATANVEYTRGTNSYGSAHADVAAAAAWIRNNAAEYQLDPHRIVAVGHSAGGYLALKLAETDTLISAAVPLAAVTELESMSVSRPTDDPVAAFLGSTRSEAPRLWEQAEITTPPAVPVQMIHGASDETVAPAHSESFSSRSGDAVSATIIDDCDHMGIIDPRGDSWRTVTTILGSFRT